MKPASDDEIDGPRDVRRREETAAPDPRWQIRVGGPNRANVEDDLLGKREFPF